MQVHGRQSSDDTRERLIDAAESLFAEHGIGGVSLREINRAAGARNAVAVQYHFGDREGIIRWKHVEESPSHRRDDAQLFAAIDAAL